MIEVYGDGDDVLVATEGDANEVADSGLTTLAPTVSVRRFSVPVLGYLLGAARLDRRAAGVGHHGRRRRRLVDAARHLASGRRPGRRAASQYAPR